MKTCKTRNTVFPSQKRQIEIGIGAPDIKSRPSIVFGNAITFLILSVLQSIQTRRSRPKKYVLLQDISYLLDEVV